MRTRRATTPSGGAEPSSRRATAGAGVLALEIGRDGGYSPRETAEALDSESIYR
jgi:hypothetical protein